MRILFTFVGGWGHADPLLPLARAAVAHGHEVRFSAQAGMVAQVERAGFECLPSGPSTLRTAKSPLVAPHLAAERAVVRNVFAGFVAAGRAEDLDPIVRSWRPDVIVCDQVDFGSMVVAEAHEIPHASVIVDASGTFVRPELVAAPLDELRRLHGLPPDPAAAMLSRHLVLAPGPPSFRDPSVPLPPTGMPMQPGVHSPPTTAAPPARPFVHITLGTIFNLESGDLFPRLLASVSTLDADVLLTIGPHLDPAELGPQPEHVRVESFVPHEDVLPRCAAVICHGGSGVVIRALSCGVPLVVLPMGADQLDNAARCEALGVGIGLDVMTASPRDIRAALDQVLDDAAYRANARALAAEVVALPDASAAVQRIEELVPT